jgi:LCP family protein required for cell wall assembly
MKKKVFRLLLILLILVVTLFGLLGLYVKNKLDLIQYDDGSRKNNATVSEPILPPEDIENDDDLSIKVDDLPEVDDVPAPELEIFGDDDILNVLILGTDERSDEFSDNARADCIMLASLNEKEPSGKLISLERGMGMVMYGGMYEGKIDLLTHCFRWGGADLMLKEIQEYFKVDVEKYVRFNFNAVIKIVDALGGVDIELSKNEAAALNTSNPYLSDGASEMQRDLTEGLNHLNGTTALAYARLRKWDSDWQRIGRQRNLVQACVDQMKCIDIITLNQLCDDVLPLIQTNFTQGELLQLLLKAPDYIGLTFDQMTVPIDRDTMGGVGTFTGGGAFAPDYELNARAIHEFIYGK